MVHVKASGYTSGGVQVHGGHSYCMAGMHVGEEGGRCTRVWAYLHACAADLKAVDNVFQAFECVLLQT